MHPTALRFQERAAAQGLVVEPVELADSTRTAEEAAAAVGCELGQIVKSVVLLDAGGEAVLCLCAGDRRVDLDRIGRRAAARPRPAAEDGGGRVAAALRERLVRGRDAARRLRGAARRAARGAPGR
jgi:hypothetical protein